MDGLTALLLVPVALAVLGLLSVGLGAESRDGFVDAADTAAGADRAVRRPW